MRKPQRRPKDDWLTIETPDLRIVSNDVWDAVHARFTAKRERYLRKTDGRLFGRPAASIDSKYLLTGFARCSVCGGSLTVRSRNGRRFFYGCTSYHLRGTAICQNGLEAPMATTDEAVLTSMERDLLHVDVIIAAVERAVAGLTDPDREREQRQILDDRLAQLDKELGALTQAIVNGEPPATLVAEMHKRERDRVEVVEHLAGLDNLRAVARLDLGHLQTEVVQCLDDWTGFLRGHVPQARQILRKLLIGRFTFTPITDEHGRRAYAFEGQGAVGRILTGLACAKSVVSPTGHVSSALLTRVSPAPGLRHSAVSGTGQMAGKAS